MNLPLKGFETLSRAKLFGEDVKALEKLLGKEKRARKTAESIILQVFRNLAPEAVSLIAQFAHFADDRSYLSSGASCRGYARFLRKSTPRSHRPPFPSCRLNRCP